MAWKTHNPPLFKAFIRFDFMRALGMFAIWWMAPSWYGAGFVWSEIPDVILIGASAIEAGREIESRWHPVIMIGAILLILLFPGVQPSASKYRFLNHLFMVRFMACGSAGLALLITSTWARRITAHAAILALFCLADASTYLAIMRGVHAQASAFVMCFHCACLIAWICVQWNDRLLTQAVVERSEN